jgi:hypothetical protein
MREKGHGNSFPPMAMDHDLDPVTLTVTLQTGDPKISAWVDDH